jgi:serine/threonine protein kinase
LEGVAYLQRSSVAHLDLKPDNIVVRRDPESKKVDLASLISTFPFLPTLNRQSLHRAARLDGVRLKFQQGNRTTPSWQTDGHAAASSWSL